jgi:hypothetical protein
MFERGRGRIETAAQGPVSTAITLAGGHEIKGKVLLPTGFGLADVLNGPNTFVEFVTLDGERIYFAKSAVQFVTPSNVPAAPDLWAGPTEGADFDPFAVLGVKPGSTRQEAHEAYVKLAKKYHPDRYATAELPTEVTEYLAVMARRINAAYHALEAEKRKQANRAEPVFTKASIG